MRDYEANAYLHKNFAFNKFTIISNLFVGLLIISNLLATKLVTFWGIILPAAVIAYPFCFMVGDVLTEVWGFRNAKKVIWLGFGINLLLTVMTNWAISFPFPSFWPGQTSYAFIFGAVPRIVVASFIGYLAGELSNSLSLEWIKTFTGESHLWIRTIGSSIIGQILDTGLFIGIAFYGTMPTAVLIQLMIAQYLFKVACEALGGTPLAYLLIGWAKK